MLVYSQHFRGKARQISEFKASLVYKTSSRTARATHRAKPCLGKNRRNPPTTNKDKLDSSKLEVRYTPVGPVLRSQRSEDHGFKASLRDT